jgi:hypothetical protein
VDFGKIMQPPKPLAEAKWEVMEASVAVGQLLEPLCPGVWNDGGTGDSLRYLGVFAEGATRVIN